MNHKPFDRKKIDLGPTIAQPEPGSPLEFEGLGDTTEEEFVPKEPEENKFPPPIIEGLEDEYIDRCKTWIREQVAELRNQHRQKLEQIRVWENLYRALPAAVKVKIPFEGACQDVIPVIAMAVDPVQARLDVGIMKQSPVFTVNPLRKSLVEYKPALEQWLEFNQQHRWQLRKIASYRFMELAKLGTAIFKTIYDREEHPIKTYDFNKDTQTFKVADRREIRFSGARVLGIQRSRFMFPIGYNDVQDCPIVAEIQYLSSGDLRIAEASGKITNVDKVINYKRGNRDDIEQQREEANSQLSTNAPSDHEVLEIWCEFDVDGDKYPEHLMATYHEDSDTLLALRYNYYFHQKKPYTVIPYAKQDGTLDGIGLCEQLQQFQLAVTRWHRMASDNAYLANTRLYVAKKQSGIEQTPRIYAGRVFYVDDPAKDFRAFQAGDIYPSTMVERQNLFGMAEKRTGVSDYLTGRESPVLGSRATATSTVALIQEGTKRVEETLENVREGLADVVEMAFTIWAQFGTEDLEDLVFGNDETAAQIKDFFLQISEKNINGAMQVTLKATDAGENKQARQQMQLAIINLMMTYFQKLLEAGQAGLQAAQQLPEYTKMVEDVLIASRKLFKDLLTTYDIKDPEQYLPAIEQYFTQQMTPPNVPAIPFAPGGAPGPAGPTGGPNLPPGLAALLQSAGSPTPAGAQGNGNGGQSAELAALTG